MYSLSFIGKCLQKVVIDRKYKLNFKSLSDPIHANVTYIHCHLKKMLISKKIYETKYQKNKNHVKNKIVGLNYLFQNRDS
jgi:hypothetical protein